jgi:hypothetical protein
VIGCKKRMEIGSVRGGWGKQSTTLQKNKVRWYLALKMHRNEVPREEEGEKAQPFASSFLYAISRETPICAVGDDPTLVPLRMPWYTTPFMVWTCAGTCPNKWVNE